MYIYYSYFKKDCHCQQLILKPKGTVILKQQKQFIDISIDFAKYRECHGHTETNFAGALSLIMTISKSPFSSSIEY